MDFKGTEKESRKCFIVHVYHRDKQTLVKLIKRLILSGTQIISDGWKAYANLEKKR